MILGSKEQLSEKGEIKRDGAKAQKNSGRGIFQKGDAIWKGFLVDYKEYPKGYRITPDNWAKVCTDTFRSGRSLFPALKIIMGEGPQKTRLAVIEWSRLEELMEYEERCLKEDDTFG